MLYSMVLRLPNEEFRIVIIQAYLDSDFISLRVIAT